MNTCSSFLLLLTFFVASCSHPAKQNSVDHTVMKENKDSIPSTIVEVEHSEEDTTTLNEEAYELSDRYVGEESVITFTSDYQFNKTPDGTEKATYRNVTIQLDDPKLFTVEGTAFEDLPVGYVIIKFEGLPEVREEIVYIGHNQSGYDIYAITRTETDSNIVYLTKSKHLVDGKSYLYTIVLGTSDLKNFTGLPPIFTAFHSNVIER